MQRSLSMPQALRATGGNYAISWYACSQGFSPHAMFGAHPFLRETKVLVQNMGGTCGVEHLCAGCAANHGEVVSVPRASPCEFARKQLAAVTGIETVVFVCKGDGAFLELGFERGLSSEESAAIMTKLGVRGEIRPTHLLRDPASPLQSRSSSCRAFSRSTSASAGSSSTREGSLGTSNEIASSRNSSSDNIFGMDQVVLPPPQPEEEVPSLGSMHHPHACQLACKYFWKPQGCKDGSACGRCHLCPFVRRAAMALRNPAEQATGEARPARPAFTGLSRHSRRRRERRAATLEADDAFTLESMMHYRSCLTEVSRDVNKRSLSLSLLYHSIPSML